MTMIKAQVDFSKKLQTWDGFGVNYVETCQTKDYNVDPQDYGGFSTLSEEKRHEILDLIFGENGLKPGVLKMFFDPFHQAVSKQNSPDPNAINMENYDHVTTSRWTRYFAKNGLKRLKAHGGDLQIVTTLYGPPGWMTKQGFVRGRDLDPKYRVECAKYMISWAKYLKEVEGLPVKYISLHNEGEDFVRWPDDGGADGFEHGHDYNMYWSPEQVVEFIKMMKPMLDTQGMKDVGVTTGEYTNWLRFSDWGYAYAIADDQEALESLGAITSHGFIRYNQNRWFSEARGLGNDILREKRPDLHAWTTSIDWGKMDVHFLNDYRYNIYASKVNALIPWAALQWSSKWGKGDPNPGTAFRIDGKGGYTVEPGYYFYKQLSCAGQPGTAVARVISNDTEIGLIGFAANGTKNTDALVVLNTSQEEKIVDLSFLGTETGTFDVFRTSHDEKYVSLGVLEADNGVVRYTVPAGSATTFYGVR